MANNRRINALSYRAIGVMIVASMFYGTAHIKLLNPMSIPDYMEKKYHKEFVFLGSFKNGDAAVAPVDEPERKIYVEVEGKMPWEIHYNDDYYSLIATEYVNNQLKEVAKSQYATEIHYSANVNYRANSAEVEGKYTLDDLKKGPMVAPDAYKIMGIFIHFYGPPKNREDMIREMHEIYKVLEKNFYEKSGGKPYVFYSVADSTVLSEKSEFKMLNTENTLIDEEMILTDIRDENPGKVWMFRVGKDSDLRKKAKLDYQYFRTIEAEIHKRVIEEAAKAPIR